jgi:hypothetical protein
MSIKGLYQTDYEHYLVAQVADTVYSVKFPDNKTVVDKKLATPALIVLAITGRMSEIDSSPITPGTETGAFELEIGTRGMHSKISLAKYIQAEIPEPPILEVKPVV